MVNVKWKVALIILKESTRFLSSISGERLINYFLDKVSIVICFYVTYLRWDLSWNFFFWVNWYFLENTKLRFSFLHLGRTFPFPVGIGQGILIQPAPVWNLLILFKWNNVWREGPLTLFKGFGHWKRCLVIGDCLCKTNFGNIWFSL